MDGAVGVDGDDGVNGDSGVDGVYVMAVWTTMAGGSSAGHANEQGDHDRSGKCACHRLPQSQAAGSPTSILHLNMQKLHLDISGLSTPGLGITGDDVSFDGSSGVVSVAIT